MEINCRSQKYERYDGCAGLRSCERIREHATKVGEVANNVQEKEFEVVGSRAEKRVALRVKEGDGKKCTSETEERMARRRWFDRVRDDKKGKGLSADDVYDRATWMHMSSYIDPHKSGNPIKIKKNVYVR